MAALQLSPTAGDEQNLHGASGSRINHDPKEGGSRIRPLERIPPVKSVRAGDTDLLSAAATLALFDPAPHHLVESVAAGLTSGLGANGIDYVGPQGNNNDDVSVIIDDPPPEPVDAPTAVSIVRLSRALIGGSLLTVGMVIGTALYKPARGVVFGGHTAMYYLVLAGIFLWGAAEASTGIWLSRSRQISNRRLTFAKIVLVLSLIPFCAILGIGGFAYVQS